MHRTDADAATVDNKFTDGNPATGAQATVLGAKWLNSVQEELCNVVESAGITLSDASDNQLLMALRRLVGTTIYAVGDFWVTKNPADPVAYWGFGTWVKRTGALYGQADGDPQFSALGAVGDLNHKHATGDHALTAAELALHTHLMRDRYQAETNSTLSGAGAANREFMPGVGYNGGAGTDGTDTNNDAFAYLDTTTGNNTGGGNPHNHGDTGEAAALPRGTVVYIWERTA